ncbi:MAG: hypothetical protein AB1633_05340 [Elusimicrobiota bacterium]
MVKSSFLTRDTLTHALAWVPRWVVLLFTLYSRLSGQTPNTGKFLTILPTPNPVNAGERITFKVSTLNQGTDSWQPMSYFLESEIFNVQKDYIGKTEQITGTQAVNTGEVVSLDVPYTIPAKFSGKYFFKVYLTRGGIRIAESELLEFNVIGMQEKVTLWKPRWLDFSGQLTLSLRNTDRNNWRNFIGNASFNGTADILNSRTNFVLDNFVTSRSTASETQFGNIENKVSNLLLKNTGENHVLAVGDVIPNFAQLALYGSGMRGLYFNLNRGRTKSETVVLRAIEPKEPDSGSMGIYERWIWGLRIRQQILPRLDMGFNYIAGEDKSNSISVSTSNPNPQRGKVYGATLEYKSFDFMGRWEISSEIMFNETQKNLFVSTDSAVTDFGYRFGINHSIKSNNMKVNFIETRPDFYSIGSRNIQNDRRMFDFSNELSITEKTDVNLGFNQWSNNISNVPGKLITTQRSYKTGFKYKPDKPLSEVTGQYTYTMNSANDISRLNNFTSNVQFLFAGEFNNRVWRVDLQQVYFIDETKIADNLLTRKITLNSNTLFATPLAADFGIGFIRTENLIKKFADLTYSYSAGTFWNAIPKKFSVQLWINHTLQSNDATLTSWKTDYSRTDTITEFSFNLKRSLTLITGVILNFKNDYLSPQNNYTEKGALLKVIMNF